MLTDDQAGVRVAQSGGITTNPPALRPTTGGFSASFAGVAIFWNAMAWGAVIVAWSQLDLGNPAGYLVFLFPAVGLLMIYGSIRQIAAALRFRGTAFLPAELPGSIGGYLGGVIQVRGGVKPTGDVGLTLRAKRTEVRRNGKNRSVVTRVLWESGARIPPDQWRPHRLGVDLPVLFHIPSGQPPSDGGRRDPRTFWELAVRAPMSGPDLDFGFEVPVKDTGVVASPPPHGQTLRPEYRVPAAGPQELAEAGVTYLPVGRDGGPTYRFSGGHLWRTRLITGVTAFLFIGAAALMAGSGLWLGVPFVGIFAAIFLGITVSLFAGAGEVEFGTSEVVLRPRGSPARERRILRSEIVQVRAEGGMNSGGQEYFRLVFEGRPGIDPLNPEPGERFAVRKLRHQLRRVMKELGISDPANGGERTRVILDQLRTRPRFSIPFTPPLPGMALSNAILHRIEDELTKAR